MRLKLPLTASVIVGVSVLLASPATLLAEPHSTPQAQSEEAALLGSIREAIVKAIGARDGTVEVSRVVNVLNVSRVNSTMNKISHAARNSEAARIAPIVSQAISGKPEFSKIYTIRVQYLAQSTTGAKGKALDTIDFRKDASGGFQFHAT